MAEKQSKEQRRKDILDAALIEFAERGYAGTSMEAIARRARASKETLYAWFHNKRTLFDTLFAARIDAVNKGAITALGKDPSPANVLPAIAEGVLRLVLAMAPLTLAAANAGAESKSLTHGIGAVIREERKNFVGYLEYCKAEGYLAFDDDPFELASLFVAMAQGEWSMRLSTGMIEAVTDDMIHEHAQRVTRIFLKALAPRPPTK